MFDGFPTAGLQFLAELAANNNKEWFNANKTRFKEDLQQPALEFVRVMGERLQDPYPNMRYDLRTNGGGSIMRIYRDTRFSKDKTPYKTGLAGMWWEGLGKKTESPAFGFELSASGIRLMGGMFGFQKEVLAAYREAVADATLGAELAELVAAIDAKDGYEIVGEHYKKVPRGFEKDHPRERLLRFASLYGHLTQSIPAEVVQSADLVDVCYDHFMTLAPIQQWLVKVMARVS